MISLILREDGCGDWSLKDYCSVSTCYAVAVVPAGSILNKGLSPRVPRL